MGVVGDAPLCQECALRKDSEVLPGGNLNDV